MNLLLLLSLLVNVLMLAGLVTVGMTVLWLAISDRGFAEATGRQAYKRSRAGAE